MKRFFLYFMLLSFAGNVDTTLDSVQKTWDATKSYEALFSQVVFSKRLGTKDESKGNLSVVKPGKIRWESKTDGTLQIINGKKLIHIHTQRRRNTKIVEIYEDISRQIDTKSLSFLAGTTQFRKSYRVDIIKDSAKTLELKLVPKDQPGGETYIAEFDKSDYVLKSLTTETADSRVRVSFSDIKTNLELGNQLFDYKPDPKDVVHINK